MNYRVNKFCHKHPQPFTRIKLNKIIDLHRKFCELIHDKIAYLYRYKSRLCVTRSFAAKLFCINAKTKDIINEKYTHYFKYVAN